MKPALLISNLLQFVAVMSAEHHLTSSIGTEGYGDQEPKALGGIALTAIGTGAILAGGRLIYNGLKHRNFAEAVAGGGMVVIGTLCVKRGCEILSRIN